MINLTKIILFVTLLLTNLHSNKLDKISLQLQWLDQFQFAGYYIAKEKGFYKTVGLELEILKYTYDLDVVSNVIAQKATFATGRTSLLIHQNNGYPVVALAAIFQHSPEALLVMDNKIKSPADLNNKKIMISDDAITSAPYMSMLINQGITKDNMVIQEHSYKIKDLIEGKTDAIAAYISNEPYKLEKKGIQYKYFHPKDYGFDFYGDILYTSRKQIDKYPIRVKNFIEASLKGWEYAFNNIEETSNIIYKKYNTQNKTLDELIYEGNILKELAYGENKYIGEINKEKFNEIAKIYKLLGLIKKDYSLEDFIFNKDEDKFLEPLKKEKFNYIFLGVIFIITLLILIVFYYRNKSLKTMSETDSLTKIANRRKIDTFLENEIERTERNSMELSIIMIDIDYFKKINDDYGHKIGDEILILIAKILKTNSRKYDLVGRWGGEEFLIICPNTNLLQVFLICKKIHSIIQRNKIKSLNYKNITVSCGLAQYIKGETMDNLIYRADTELYKAKNSGRNCILPSL